MLFPIIMNINGLIGYKLFFTDLLNHIHDEEKMMESIHYKDIDEHKEQHKNIVLFFSLLDVTLDNLEDIKALLYDKLNDHIKNFDDKLFDIIENL